MVEAASLRRVDGVWDDGWPRDTPRGETSDEGLCRRVAQRDGEAFDMRVIGVTSAHTGHELSAGGAERGMADFAGLSWPM